MFASQLFEELRQLQRISSVCKLELEGTMKDFGNEDNNICSFRSQVRVLPFRRTISVSLLSLELSMITCYVTYRGA